jgi:hypothetical protein
MKSVCSVWKKHHHRQQADIASVSDGSETISMGVSLCDGFDLLSSISGLFLPFSSRLGMATKCVRDGEYFEHYPDPALRQGFLCHGGKHRFQIE